MRSVFSRSAGLWFVLLFGLTSCFELVEEIEIKKDKSGSVSYRIESEEGGSFIENMTGMLQLSVDDAVRSEAEKMVRALQAQPGISNIHFNLSGSITGSSIQFDFDHPKSLNAALYKISGNTKKWFSPGYFKVGCGGFKRINFAPWITRYLEKEKIDLPPAYVTDLVAYKTVVHVPADIRKVKPTGQVKQTADRKAEARYLLTNVLDESVNTGMKIRY
jgi:hypothetical protein